MTWSPGLTEHPNIWLATHRVWYRCLISMVNVSPNRLPSSTIWIRTRHLGLLPEEPVQRARAQALAHAIAVDLHPVCNLSVVKHATRGEEPARTQWMQHFITPGLAAFETMMADFEQIPFCIGNTPSLADICLMPQLYNAERWGADYTKCPRIITGCQRLP